MFGAKKGMIRRRKDREQCCQLKKGYYHLVTDGWKDGFLFHTKLQYAYGMIVMGLLTLLFDIKIYGFTLMPNHVHIIVSGTGSECLKAFDYLRLKLSARLVKDGYAPVPDDYWFKLVPINSQDQMRSLFLYVDRNPYEDGISVPGGYPWGSAYICYSFVTQMITAPAANTFSLRELERITGTRKAIPSHWQFHPDYGLLPISFVDTSLFEKLFNSPKDYLSRIVKDYESAAKVASSIGEAIAYSKEEMDDIVKRIVQLYFSGKRLSMLTNDEKGKIAVMLMKDYNMSDTQIASALIMSEHLVAQFLRAKDYGKRR